MNDTDKQSDAVRWHILRGMRPGRRLMMAVGWSTALRQMIRAGLQQQFKGASEEHLRRLFAERWLGRELAEKAYGPSESHG